MRILNPIYDAVFKYLLEDEESAKLIISTIIGMKVISLSPQPSEKATKKEKARVNEPRLGTCRLDYAAIIETSSGKKRVIIEIQKSNILGATERFRLYLGKQYATRG